MRSILLFFFFLPAVGHAQKAYQKGDVVANLNMKKILNHTSSSSSLQSMKGNITIIDFFGTWCAPCIKALPELASYKAKFKEEITVILVSTEEETKLTRFISSRKPFAFPVVVDEEYSFTDAFAPPSYPYTIVLDKDLKILSVTHVADLTDTLLEKMIEVNKMKDPVPVQSPMVNENKPAAPVKTFAISNNALVKLSQEFIYAAKTKDSTSVYINQLRDLNYNDLILQLKDDDDKKTFWVNLYNAYTNVSLQANPGQYKSRNNFFKNKNIIVAGKTFSLDKIEHGILRRSSIKWSLGYFSKLFPGKTEKALRVNTLDYRIHFALNCGARSCPPIAFYNPENLDAQLDVAATAYLTAETGYDAGTNVLQLPAILSWFRRDFGGKKKIIQLLKTKQLLAPGVYPEIKFKQYDWTLYLDNYKQ